MRRNPGMSTLTGMPRKTLTVVLAFCFAISALPAGGSEEGALTALPRSDDNWQVGFEPRGIEGNIYDTIIYQGDLIVAGYIVSIMGEPFNHLARFDGSQWHPLNSNFSGTPTCLAVWDGKLVVGGHLSSPYGGVALWDGETWSALDGGPGEPVRAMTVFAGELIAKHHRWTGSAWEPLAGGTPDGNVEALTVYGEQLYIGGSFDEIGGIEVNGIAVWDGAGFSALDGGAQGGMYGGNIYDLRIWDGLLVAGGDFSNIGGVITDCVAAWNGVNWIEFGDMTLGGYYDEYNGYYVDPMVYALGEFCGELIIGGYFRFFTDGPDDFYGIARWDGESWSDTNGGLGNVNCWNEILFFEEFGGKLFVGGGFYHCGGVHSPSLATWDGLNWAGFGGNGTDYKIETFCKYGDDVIAGGSFSGAGAASTRAVARWDGTDWQPMADGLNYTVNACILYEGEPVVGGFFTSNGSETSDLRCVAHWDGAAWQPLGLGISGGLADDFPEVEALAVYNGDLIAGGAFCIADGSLAWRIARWDGSAWAELGGGINHGFAEPSYRVRALAVHDGDLIVGGTFAEAGELPVANIVRWDGTQWQDMGGTNDRVCALWSYNGDLIAGGGFHAAGGTVSPGVARWDGSQWHAMTASMDYRVLALGQYGNRLTVGGTFNSIDGVVYNGVALWDGAGWSDLGSGLDGNAYAVLGLGEDLYVGGLFDLAGDKRSQNFGLYHEDFTAVPQVPAAAAKDMLEAAYPNPFNPATTLSFTLLAPTRVRLSIHDVRGRCVRTLLAGQMDSGAHTTVWNGLDDRGRAVASGTYFCHLRLDDELLASKLTLLK